MKYSKYKYIFSGLLLTSYVLLYLFYFDYLKIIPQWIITLLWGYFIFDILRVMIPKFSKYSSSGKHLKKFYKETKYNKQLLSTYMKKMKFRVSFTFFLYIIFILTIGYFYSINVIDNYHIIFIVISLNFIDYFCINSWCVFHKIFIRNRCCNTCRIYNWDHFMKFGPFIYILDYRTWSLFILGTLAFIQWEFLYNRNPERFSDISNANLKCSNCLLECRFKTKAIQ